jgi:hypothetical protein
MPTSFYHHPHLIPARELASDVPQSKNIQATILRKKSSELPRRDGQAPKRRCRTIDSCRNMGAGLNWHGDWHMRTITSSAEAGFSRVQPCSGQTLREIF